MARSNPLAIIKTTLKPAAHLIKGCIFTAICGGLSGCTTFHKDPSDWFGQDKIAHFTASAALAAAGYDHARKNGEKECSAVRLGVTFSLSIGVAKEAKDKWISGSYWSSKDIVADLLGAIAGALAASECY